MKKFLLSMLAVCACAILGYAETVTFDFTAENAYGIESPTEASTGTDLTPNQKIAEGAVTMEAVFPADATNKIRIWRTTKNALELRGYKSQSLKFTCAENITGIKFEGGKIANLDWAGTPATEVDVVFSATVNITKITVTYGEGGGEVTPPAEGALYEATFDKTAGQGDFTIDNVTLPEELSYVWKHDSSYGYMKASAYISSTKTNYASEAILVSPVFDASKATKIALSFEQAWNFFADVETAKVEAAVVARVKGGEWQTLAVPNVPTSMGWTFVASGDIDLSSFVGKQFEIGFRYTSTDAKAGTWEIKNFKLTGEGTVTTEAPEVKPTEVANIKAFLDGKDANVTYKFANPVTTVYQSGSRLFVQDATGSLLVYGNVGQTYKKGDVIPAGFTGKYGEYSGAAQLSSPADFAASTTTADVQMEEVAVEELATDMAITYVKLTGVTIAAGEKEKYYTAEQDGATVTLYDQFGINPAVGENLTVIGIVSVYNGALQVYPIEVTDEGGTVVVRVANPVFTPGAGAVIAGTKVVISTTTEGAEIHYTVDGTEPTAASTLYTEAIEVSEAMTIKAIAVKEGAEDSEVVTAEYTIREAGEYKGDFDSFNNATADNRYGTYTNATGWTAENSAILSGNEEGAADNNPKFAFIGDPYTLAPTLNGKASAPGKLTSPVLTNGIGTLTFDYGFAFSDKQVKLNIQILDADGNEVASDVLEETNLAKQTAYSYSHEFNKVGDFKIVITNGCLTGTDKNVDRLSIWHLTWTNYSSGVEGVAAEDMDAPVEYFNLQGVRVAAPEAGIFIRRQGSKVEKVVIR